MQTLLNQGNVFKLVCGAGNEDYDAIFKLVNIYAKAGCRVFDVSANIEAVDAAKKGVLEAGVFFESFIGVSVGIADDPHMVVIDPKKCRHCMICTPECEYGAKYRKNKSLKEIIPKLVAMCVDFIEYHANSLKEVNVLRQWDYLQRVFPGVLSVCMDRSLLGSVQYILRIKRMLEGRVPYTTIIQADGNPMSGCCNDVATTLQAVATAQIVQKESLPAYLLVSGGTNPSTRKLCGQAGVNPHGIAMGTYARDLVRGLSHKDAIDAAATLIRSCTNDNS